MKSPELEQSICITCGFCCDGTLFDSANLKPGEKGNLPQYMEDNYIKVGDNETFLLPCKYFNGKCSIYNRKKAIVCSSFRCQLLKNFSANNVELDRALKIVESGKLMREDIFRVYSLIFPTVEEQLNFRSLLKNLIKFQDESAKDNKKDKSFEILIGKCNIYEALLIRYFKSMDDFNQMIEIENEQST